MRRHDDQIGLQLSQRLGLPDVVGTLLAQRGFKNADDAERFLLPRLRDSLPDPSHLLDLDLAVERIADAIQHAEMIGIIGDYDVDGASSSALLSRYLSALNTPHAVEIPDRFVDGYGPNRSLFSRLADQGCRLVLTLDCGTTAHQALGDANSLGQEVVVIDHHVAESELPPAFAVINPNRRDQESELTGLAAVGVVFVFLVGLSRELRNRGHFKTVREPDLLEFLDLVALGTVCDVVPLTGLNRSLVAQGLKRMGGDCNPGIRALADRSGYKRLDSTMQLGFGIGPRINAGGRLGFSALGYNLLSVQDPDEINQFADRLHQLNVERQQIERSNTSEAKAMLEAEGAADGDVLVVASTGWHKGVIGIVASRLADRFDKPAIVISIDDQGIGTGSARSRRGFDIGQAVIDAKNQGLLIAGGGHKMAAGLTVEHSKIEALRDALCGMADGQITQREKSPLTIDCAFAPGALNVELASTIQRMEPFGTGNEEPRFCLQAVTSQPARILKNRHVATSFRGQDGSRVDTIAFSVVGTPLGDLLTSPGETLDLAGRLRADEYMGRRTAKLHIEDASRSQS